MHARTPRKILTSLTYRLLHTAARLTRPLTLGVRGIVLDGENRVFLVRNSYVPGWHFPGGGVEPGETALGALARELMEEGNIAVAGEPVPHGLFFNDHVGDRDHVMVYVVRAFQQSAPKTPDLETVETGFFPRDALPAGVTRACRARLAEVLDGAPVSDRW